MKKVLLSLIILFFATAASAQSIEQFRVQAKHLSFFAVDGPGHCNGIKAYGNGKPIFDLGFPECPPTLFVRGFRLDFQDRSYSNVLSIAHLLNSFVTEFDGETWLIVDTFYWTDFDPTSFITEDKNSN